MVAVDFGNVKTDGGLSKLDKHLSEHSYVVGAKPTHEDTAVFGKLLGCPGSKYPHATRWYKHISSFTDCERVKFSGGSSKPCAGGKTEKDDDFDLFGEETAEEKATGAAMKAAAAAPKKKKEVIQKSQLVIDVKPASLDVSLDDLEAKIRALQINGLEWSVTCKRVPIAFGLMKVQIGANIVDSLVNTDDVLAELESIGLNPEQKAAFLKRREAGEEEEDEDSPALVLSAEIVSFNKL